MEEGDWALSLRKSWTANQCLAISQYIYVATVHEGLPCNTATTFRGFSPNSGISCYLDQRSALFAHITTSPCALLWSFPLTNEIYRFPHPQAEVITDHSDERVATAWRSLKDRERLGYVGLSPDTLAGEAVPHTSHDLEVFNPQRQDCISQHFAVVVFRPVEVEHTRYIDKTAIGNTRKTFESLPQPEIQPQRWVHRLDGAQWSVQKANLPHPCP